MARERVSTDRGGETAEHERALAADHHQAHARRQRDTERGEHERRRARERVLPGKRAGEGTAIDQRVHLDRRLADRRHEHAEHDHGGREREKRDREGLAGPHTLPMTPSTR